MYKLGILFTLLLLNATVSFAQRKVRNQLKKPLQEAIHNHLSKEKESIRIHLDSIAGTSEQDLVFSEEDVLIGQRIHRMQKTVSLEYNDRVKAYLDKYISKNYKPYMEKLLGLSEYYFPIYEAVFEETGIPDEVKYLSVVESSLNPHTLSTAGALGPWQFIYGTAKIYNLSMDGLYDERKDVFSSTYAVSQYLNEAYTEFNDWLLALASYNCGRGCVRRAIIRSGMIKPTFWELSPYLPKETRNYIPKFVAMTYALNHADIYGLSASESPLQQKYEVLMVDKQINMNHVANAIGCSVEVLKDFNPAFKKDIVNGSVESPKRLIIPHHEERSDSLLYLALNNQVGSQMGKEDVDNRLANNLSKAKSVTNHSAVATKSKYVVHTVKRGDTLSGIVTKYRGSTINRLKADNNIKGSHLSIGQKVKVYQGKG